MNIQDLESALASIKIPTEAECIEISSNWFKPHEFINPLTWSKELIKHTYPFEAYKIPKHLLDEIVKEPMDFDFVRNGFDKLTKDSQFIDGDFFIKLITRSPKDYNETGRYTSVEQGVTALLSSMRTMEDFYMFDSIPDKCHFILRPFVDIPKQSEFRGFVKGNKLVGISQYHYSKTFEWIGENKELINTKLTHFVNENIIPNMPIDDYVLDLVFDEVCKFIEINPYGLSDPCLFENYNNFNGDFKYN